MPYTYRDLLEAYEKLGVGAGQLVYVLSDLRWLMEYDKPGEAVLVDHVKALRELIGSGGTIVMPTSSINLCNTDIVFDVERTPSYRVGVLAEYFRKLDDSRRNFHPFISMTANGPLADDIVCETSRHAFGPETPMDRLLKLDAKTVSIGHHPRWTATIVHHVEHVMAVPYRYTKEFLHPVQRRGEVVVEPFYRHVIYRDIGVEREVNKKLWEYIRDELGAQDVDVGRGKIYTYRLRHYYELATREFAKDIYVWCGKKPHTFPYRT